MTLEQAFANLRNILANIYKTKTSAERIARDAGLNEERITFGDAAIDTWHSLLTEAEHCEGIDTLFRVVLGEYGTNSNLRSACEAYIREAKKAAHEKGEEKEKTSPLTGSPLASGLLVQGRAPGKNLYVIGGTDQSDHIVGDTLAVYKEIIPSIEVPIALLCITAIYPKTLLAQAILEHPEFKIDQGLRVDSNPSYLTTTELVPVSKNIPGYLLCEQRVRLGVSNNVKENTDLVVVKPEIAGGSIIKYVETATRMCVTDLVADDVFIAVELKSKDGEKSGEWPPVGTLVQVPVQRRKEVPLWFIPALATLLIAAVHLLLWLSIGADQLLANSHFQGSVTALLIGNIAYFMSHWAREAGYIAIPRFPHNARVYALTGGGGFFILVYLVVLLLPGPARPIPVVQTPSIPPTSTPAVEAEVVDAPPSPTSTPECFNAPWSGVKIGDTIEVVTLDDPLIVRPEPAATNEVLDRLYPRQRVVVQDGPSCARNEWWWKIRAPNGEQGWIREGTDAVDPRFIKPIDESLEPNQDGTTFGPLLFCTDKEYDRQNNRCLTSTDRFTETTELLWVSWSPLNEYKGTRFRREWYRNGRGFLSKTDANEFAFLRASEGEGLIHADYMVRLFSEETLLQEGSFSIGPTRQPDEMVRAYWDKITKRHFQSAWKDLSPGFQEREHASNYDHYLGGYKELNICQIEVKESRIVEQDAARAIVNIGLTYFSGDDCNSSSYNFDLYLIFDANHSTWLIDRVRRLTVPPTPTPLPTPTLLPTATPTAAATVTPASGGTPANFAIVYLRPACGNRVELHTDEPVELHYGFWSANGEERLLQNLEAIEISVTLDGQPIEGELIGPVATLEEEGLCSRDYVNSYWSYYTAQIDRLSPGSHLAVITFTFTELVNDGYGDVYEEPLVQRFTLIAP